MAKQWQVKNKVFIVTGGASGLGAAYIEAFLKEGAKHMIIWDIAEDMGETTTKRLNNIYGNRVTFMRCDMSKEEDIVLAFQHVITDFKYVDVIINNAGIMVDTVDMWRTACTVNIQGVMSLTLKGIEFMRKDKDGAGGTIINISSTLAFTKGPFLPIYSSAKMAVLHFSQCISMDPFYSETGIRLLIMCPGATNTPLLQELDKKTYDPKLGQILIEVIDQRSALTQKIESASRAFVYMFKNGSPGSIWLSIDDKPARDITSLIDEGFKTFEKEILFTE